ncbi:MAG: carbonic anhydrase [Pseudomonadota bacterium]
MDDPKPLPSCLVRRYQGWHATGHDEHRVGYRRLVLHGQHPRAMVMSCCDSRIYVASISGADQGECFLHRNIANLVPPSVPAGEYRGTPAAIEYVVRVFQAAHLIVPGPSRRDNVQECRQICTGAAPQPAEKTSFIGHWLDIRRPEFALVDAETEIDTQLSRLEKQAARDSCGNRISFQFVRDRVVAGLLTLHRLWTDIGAGGLGARLPEPGDCRPV